jgi:hypothetical protein
MQDIFVIPINKEYGTVIQNMNNGTAVFEETTLIAPKQLPGEKYKQLRGYVPWGEDNLRPQQMLEMQRKDEVLSSNRFFNILSGYGLGVTYTNDDGSKVTNKEVIDFFTYNRNIKYLLEQMTDIKHWFFSVAVIILNAEGSKVVRLVHKDAMYCRFETANPKTGKIEHVFYGDWEKSGNEDFEVIELLDPVNPLGDLMVKMGKLPNEEGKMEMSKTRKFAILNEIPTPGNNYYPFPYDWAIFQSGWFDIKQMIPEGKKAKFKNGVVLNYQIEINKDYWGLLYQEEKITDPEKQMERMKKEKDNIREFLMGIANSGKVWFSGYYVNPATGKEVSMVKINLINNTKEGGDWIEDTEEASNMECYAQGVHPSLIGATPGKTKGSFSGSDKRELFTMKQSLEVVIRQLLMEPYFVIQHFNGWTDIKFDIPFIMLTTLDQKTDGKKTTTNTQESDDN